MKRSTVLLLILALWAAIYLPGLGEAELKGEEGRRILPALAMLENGDWVVPEVNGRPYFRKPPLINWVIALSVEATGQVSEWSVRLPSVLATLALALTLGWTGSRWLGNRGGLVAALFFLTSVSFLEKGRLAEIEAVYVAQTGIALAWFMAAWARREKGWRLWLVPGIALGLGILTKGPVPHLLFFYAVAVALLWASRELRELRSAGHFAALAVMAGITLAWYLPYRAATAQMDATAVMTEQLAERFMGVGLEWRNLLGAFSNGLPWILLSLFWWNKRVLQALGERDERLALMVKALRWPMLVGFIGLMLIVGMLPRYTLPLLPAMALLWAAVLPEAPASWLKGWHWGNRVLAILLLGVALAAPFLAKPATPEWAGLVAVVLGLAGAVWWIWRRGGGEPSRLATGTALCAAGAMGIYGFALLPRISLTDELAPVGPRVHAVVPEGVLVHVVDPGYEASLFYVRRPLAYVRKAKDLPPEARYALLRRSAMEKGKKRLEGAGEPVS